MSAFRVKRPVGLAIKTVIERHAAVEAGAVRAEIIQPKLEAVLFAVEIADVEVAIHGVGGFVHHDEVLDLGATDAIEPRAKRTVGRRLGDHRDERSSLRAKQRRVLDLNDDTEYVLALQRIHAGDFRNPPVEPDPARKLLIDEERIEAAPGEDVEAPGTRSCFVADADRNLAGRSVTSARL